MNVDNLKIFTRETSFLLFQLENSLFISDVKIGELFKVLHFTFTPNKKFLFDLNS